jgi:hypothetical protein
MDHRPLSIGRLPESDVVVNSEGVSRVHAYLVPTPHGPLLVDRSRHGTLVNGEPMRAPWLLTAGDEIRVGPAVLKVSSVPLPGSAPTVTRSSSRIGSKLMVWVRRYAPSEVLGAAAAVSAAVGMQALTGSDIAGAYAGALAEDLAFYGVMLVRESIREAHQAGARGRPFTIRDLATVLRNLLMEFGVAGMLDVSVVRPLCLGLGLSWVGGAPGAFLGKVAADAVFYGPVLAIYEWRLARHAAREQRDRRRRTTAAGLVPLE